MHATRTPMELLTWICGVGRDALPAPRTLVVFAHPDDETVAASAVLGRLRKARFVYVTDGAPRDERDARAAGFLQWEDYANARKAELRTALALVGIRAARIQFLGIPDQQAALNLFALTRGVAALLCREDADVVLTHPYEGGHPDHDATAFAVHHACRLLQARRGSGPAIVEAACYHGRAGRMVFGEFVPTNGPEIVVHLDNDAASLKRQMVARHATQRDVLRHIRLDAERFRLAPPYRFDAAPPGEEVLYDRFAWGLTSGRWLPLAGAAMEELACIESVSEVTQEKEVACR